MDRLYRLFEQKYGARPSVVCSLTGSASPRLYYRMSDKDIACIGVIGTDKKENEAFVALAEHFRSKGIKVPQVYAVSDDHMAYIQEDLGGDVLYDRYVKARNTGEGLEEVEELLIKTMSLLPKVQIEGASDLDFAVCHPQQCFKVRSAMFDLNYFKYCFLKPVGLEFHEMLLQDDFEKFAADLAACMRPEDEGAIPSFLYRDFQSRNIMLKDGEPYFVDFQGGRRGPIYYDVASFVYHARAGYDDRLKGKMLDAYLDSLSRYMDVDRDEFVDKLRLFRLFRCLQVLGAYGFRGWVEKKANFVVTIPEAVRSLAELLEQPYEDYPYMMEVLKEMVALPRFVRSSEDDSRLHVRVSSFSFKSGVPEDPTGNGGGYVFDCRSIHNPGRYEPYKKLTGRDEPVIKFLEDDGEVFSFLEHVYGVVDSHVETYSERGFNSLMVSFGCTGGQHRSVYCAEHLAHHLAEKYPDIKVQLIHREQNINEIL
jgi:aminoglycoside/choline kinase family phosphotransferase